MADLVATQESRDWPHLEEGLLELILSKLSFIDTIRFDHVCSAWNSVTKLYLESSRYTSCPNQLPWLLTLSDFHRQLCNLEENKMYKITNHELLHLCLSRAEIMCFGSSHGWIFLRCKSKTTELFMILNPFSQGKIDLPFLHKIDYKAKAILLSDPAHDDNAIIVFIHGDGCGSDDNTIFSSYKMGIDTESKIVSATIGEIFYDDITCSNDRVVYILISDRTVEAWDFNHDIQSRKLRITPTLDLINDTRLAKDCYLVDSSGKLLLLTTYLRYTSLTRKVHFHVYELNFNTHKWKWVRVNSLGDTILFIDPKSHSVSVSTEDFPPNLAEEDSIYLLGSSRWCGLSSIFSLRDTSLKGPCMHRGYLEQASMSAMWITPSRR